MRKAVDDCENLTLRQAEVRRIVVEHGRVTGVETTTGGRVACRAVVACCGVYLLQEKLIELGYMKGEPDGVYGKDCAECVKAYQKDKGMEPTGVADVALQEMIFGVPSGA